MYNILPDARGPQKRRITRGARLVLTTLTYFDVSFSHACAVGFHSKEEIVHHL